MRTHKGLKAGTLEALEWVFAGLFSIGLAVHGYLWQNALAGSGAGLLGPGFSNLTTVVVPGLLIVPIYLLYSAGLAMDRYGSGATPILCRRWSLRVGLILLVFLAAANAAFFTYVAI